MAQILPFPKTDISLDEAITEYLDAIRNIARRFACSLPPHANIEEGDLFSIGALGAIDALQKMDYSRPANSREAYVEQKIRGAILDELRLEDAIPRSARDFLKLVEKTEDELHREGIEIDDVILADKLDIPVERYRKRRLKGNLGFVSVGDIGTAVENRDFYESCPADTLSPEELASSNETSVTLQKVLETFSERHQYIFHEFYVEGRNLGEIGDDLGITESRVSQLHSAAILALREMLKGSELDPLSDKLKQLEKLGQYPQSEIFRIGFPEDVMRRAFPLCSLDKEPHYYGASILGAVASQSQHFNRSLNSNIYTSDLLGITRLGSIEIDPEVVREQVDLFAQRDFLTDDNRIPLRYFNQFLYGLLEAQFDQERVL